MWFSIFLPVSIGIVTYYVCLFVSLSLSLSMWFSIFLPVSIGIVTYYVCFSLSLSLPLSMWFSIFLPVSIGIVTYYVCLFVSLSLSLSMWFSIFLRIFLLLFPVPSVFFSVSNCALFACLAIVSKHIPRLYPFPLTLLNWSQHCSSIVYLPSRSPLCLYSLLPSFQNKNQIKRKK